MLSILLPCLYILSVDAWQGYREHTTTWLYRHVYKFATMIVNHFLGDAQAEPVMGTVCSVFIYPIKAIKDTGLVFGGDSWAVVPDGYRNLFCLELWRSPVQYQQEHYLHHNRIPQ